VRIHLPLAGCVAAVSLLASCGGGGADRSASAKEAGRYSHRLHNRFHEAWVQPKTVGAPRGKVSVPVNIRIAQDGRVLSFTPVRLSGYPRIDESILAVGQRVTRVAPPPNAGEFRLRVYFDLDVKP
jgi:TonB family protein